MRKKPEILNTQIIAKSRLFEAEQVDLRFSNGVKRVFERIRGRTNGSVIILPLLDDNTVLLVREYAAGLDNYQLGLPKGVVEKDEDVLETANRELMEEVGYGAQKLQLLKIMTVAPGYLSATTKLVLAEQLYEKRLPGDEPEEIEVVPWQLDNLDELFARDDVTEARSIAALYMARDIINNRRN